MEGFSNPKTLVILILWHLDWTINCYFICMLLFHSCSLSYPLGTGPSSLLYRYPRDLLLPGDREILLQPLAVSCRHAHFDLKIRVKHLRMYLKQHKSIINLDNLKCTWLYTHTHFHIHTCILPPCSFYSTRLFQAHPTFFLSLLTGYMCFTITMFSPPQPHSSAKLLKWHMQTADTQQKLIISRTLSNGSNE